MLPDHILVGRMSVALSANCFFRFQKRYRAFNAMLKRKGTISWNKVTCVAVIFRQLLS